MPDHISVVVPLLVASLLATVAHPLDRRVVDVALAGTPGSESAHGYVGNDVITGEADGQPFRQARGWMRYALTTFDDTEVTVACTFVALDTVPHQYEVIVEDSVVATRTFGARPRTTMIAEILVPFAVTRGKTNIAIIIRARGGATPALRELRTIQDHNEIDLPLNLPGVVR